MQPSTGWCSHKFHEPGLPYELGIAIYDNRLVWINGPFQAAENDLSIMHKEDGLLSKIPAGKKVIADRGYRGEPVCSIRNPRDTAGVKAFKRRARARHESFNGRIKWFNILDTRFRHGIAKHQAVFEAVCVITQYEMENGHPLFDV